MTATLQIYKKNKHQFFFALNMQLVRMRSRLKKRKTKFFRQRDLNCSPLEPRASVLPMSYLAYLQHTKTNICQVFCIFTADTIICQVFCIFRAGLLVLSKKSYPERRVSMVNTC